MSLPGYARMFLLTAPIIACDGDTSLQLSLVAPGHACDEGTSARLREATMQLGATVDEALASEPLAQATRCSNAKAGATLEPVEAVVPSGLTVVSAVVIAAVDRREGQTVITESLEGCRAYFETATDVPCGAACPPCVLMTLELEPEPGTLSHLDLELPMGCEGIRCGEGETCEAGSCVDARISCEGGVCTNR